MPKMTKNGPKMPKSADPPLSGPRKWPKNHFFSKNRPRRPKKPSTTRWIVKIAVFGKKGDLVNYQAKILKFLGPKKKFVSKIKQNCPENSISKKSGPHFGAKKSEKWQKKGGTLKSARFAAQVYPVCPGSPLIVRNTREHYATFVLIINSLAPRGEGL